MSVVSSVSTSVSKTVAAAVVSLAVGLARATILEGVRIGFEAKPSCNVVPLLIEDRGLVAVHVFEVIIAAEVIVACLLSDDLATSVVEHSLVTCFLHTGARVLVELLPVHYLVTTAMSTVSFGLIDFFDRSAIGTSCHLAFVGVLHELALAQLLWSRHVTHSLTHLVHHLVSSGEHVTSHSETAVFKEGVVVEHATSKAFHHLSVLLHHAVGHVVKVSKDIPRSGELATVVSLVKVSAFVSGYHF